MDKEKFLLWILAGIFISQFSVFAVSLGYCMNNGGLKACPNISQSYEKTFNVMIATTLALLTGAAINKGKSECNDCSKTPEQK